MIAIENNKYNPSLDLAFKLARYFKVSIEDIFAYDEEGTPNAQP
jgi:putative transcriptional regulator